MKRAHNKLIVGLLLVVLLVGFTACTKAEEPETEAVEVAVEETEEMVEEVAEEVTLTGEITVSGSTSVEPVGVALGEEFTALNPDVTFTYEGIGSSGGVKNANDGTTMIGTASRNIKDSEKEYGMTEQVLAYDGIAVVVNPANGVSDLTLEQVQGIYLGEITNWSEVGGADAEIAVVSREDGSGTRGAFEELVDFEDALTASAIIKEGNGNVQTTVAGNELAIGYVSFTYLDDTIKGVAINGVLPSIEAVLDATYPVSRPFNIVYHEENLTDAAKAWLEWVTSDEAKEIISEKGAIPLD
ncbi:MAG: phosphate ABC transporter substrate-binding protein [Eubacteriales bacterium]